MKKCIVLLLLCIGAVPYRAAAQETELMQLALNIEKLAQFKQILSDLKKGYEILTGGYNIIKNVSEGNFNLHKVFLDGLSQVSPTVKNYRRVGDIIADQLQLAREYKRAFAHLTASGQFTVAELDYQARVYDGLVKGSLTHLSELLSVVTAGTLRMSDAERLTAIDRIYTGMEDKLHFLRWFNSQQKVEALQRAREAGEVKVVEKLSGL